MIEIIGVSTGREFDAAKMLREKMLALWPDLAQSSVDFVRMFVGLKIYGYRIEDIDIVVLAHFEKAREFDVEFDFIPRNDSRFLPKRAFAKSFILVVETKSHDASGIRFDDKVARVKYVRANIDTWEDATEQNRVQMFELKRYFEDNGVSGLFFQNLIFFSGLRESDFPKRPHNFFGIDASFSRILNILGQISGPLRTNRECTISFGSDKAFKSLLDRSASILRTLEPTALDRKRMDRIAKGAIREAWLEAIGKKQLCIRGRGGVGKTVVLLQLAYRAFDLQSCRSLVLTYNKALVCDMRRTMALLGVPRSLEDGGISIDTVHAFFGKLAIAFGIAKDWAEVVKSYEKLKNSLLEFLGTEAISAADIRNLLSEQPEAFAWDAILVDEGQDWPANEIKILRSIYGSDCLVVADGIDQLVRRSIADWSLGIAKDAIRIVRLTRCLRMKANLASFVSQFARKLGLQDWDLEPNPDANGGKVIIVEGDLANDVDFYARILKSATSLGNYAVDLLACVPPNLVHTGDEGSVQSSPGMALSRSGHQVWDGVSPEVRANFPTSRDALRIVQYDSCRGLEGWVVFNYGFDSFFDYKFTQALSSPPENPGLFESNEEVALRTAARWATIPLTRAMDTIVINISSPSSELVPLLRELQRVNSDFVEWVTCNP